MDGTNLQVAQLCESALHQRRNEHSTELVPTLFIISTRNSVMRCLQYHGAQLQHLLTDEESTRHLQHANTCYQSNDNTPIHSSLL